MNTQAALTFLWQLWQAAYALEKRGHCCKANVSPFPADLRMVNEL